MTQQKLEIGCKKRRQSLKLFSVLCICHPRMLMQATHMTGGLYLRPKTPSALLQYLCTAFSVNSFSRKFLELPASQGIDFKATCFCHSNVISVGFVCSVCLSVFCQNQPECLTCGTTFPSNRISERQATPA